MKGGSLGLQESYGRGYPLVSVQSTPLIYTLLVMTSFSQTQADLRDIRGSVPDHHKKASVTYKVSLTEFLVSQGTRNLCLHYTVI